MGGKLSLVELSALMYWNSELLRFL